MNNEFKIPFYAKATISLIGIIALLSVLHLAQGIILPIVFAIIIAITLHPLVTFFVRKKINRVIAIVIVMSLTFLLVSAMGILLFSQASRFSESWPILVEKFTLALKQTIAWSSDYFDINPQILYNWVTKTKDGLINGSGTAIGQTLATLGNGLEVLILVPIYVFMLLFYHPLLMEFIHKLFRSSNQSHVNEIVSQTKTLIQRYIIGLLAEAIIVAALYSIGLLIIGIDYAILLGFIAALFNIIPFIGGIIALALIMIITIATKNSATFPLLVTVLAIVIHLIDNSYIIPKIVASKVKINAFISIMAVLSAGALLSIPGMIICIPIIGIIKLIFDRIEPLKPWGFLLGDTMPKILKSKQEKESKS